VKVIKALRENWVAALTGITLSLTVGFAVYHSFHEPPAVSVKQKPIRAPDGGEEVIKLN
jgi:hypothetical protein